jgi:SAM-dependent methyltransferase
MKCALVFCSPMPTLEDLAAYYQGFAYSKPDEKEFARQIAYTEAGTRSAVKEIGALTRRPICKVLDFGGGLGFFASAFSQHYPDVTLFDLDAQSRDFANCRFAGRFRVVDTAEEALSERYDLILLNQVIEHVPDPVAFLRSFRDALEPGGVMVVTTPNNETNDMFARPDVLLHYTRAVGLSPAAAVRLLAKDSWLCCDPPRHLFAFNGGNLRAAAEAAGFGSLKITTAYFDKDPYGQPKYRPFSLRSARSAAMGILHWVTAVATPVVRIGHLGKGKGTTLIGYFTGK